MSKEFERLKALLHFSDPNDWEPQVDRDEAAKLAARWGWMVGRARERRAELPQMRRPDRSALFGPSALTGAPVGRVAKYQTGSPISERSKAAITVAKARNQRFGDTDPRTRRLR